MNRPLTLFAPLLPLLLAVAGCGPATPAQVRDDGGAGSGHAGSTGMAGDSGMDGTAGKAVDAMGDSGAGADTGNDAAPAGAAGAGAAGTGDGGAGTAGTGAAGSAGAGGSEAAAGAGGASGACGAEHEACCGAAGTCNAHLACMKLIADGGDKSLCELPSSVADAGVDASATCGGDNQVCCPGAEPCAPDFICVTAGSGQLCSPASGGTWTTLASPFPESVSPNGPQQPILLLDGSILIAASAKNMHWYRLTPDSTGSYENGTWSQMADSNVWRSAYASQVMADGRVWVFGGEFATPNTSQNANPKQGEIYDPVANTWTLIPSASYQDCPYFDEWIGDDPSVVLPDGTILTQIGYRGNLSSNSAYPQASCIGVYSPATNSWSAGFAPSTSTPNLTEAGLTILQDGTIFTLDAGNDGQTCYRYDQTISSGNPWISCARSPSQLGGGQNGSHEIGPQALLYSGQVLVLGDETPGSSTANIGLYAPPPASDRTGTGSWASNLPAIPNGLKFSDMGSCVMPNGKVLIEGTREGDGYPSFYEYDPSANTFSQTTSAPTFASTVAMLPLPTGQILVVNGPSSNKIWLYMPDGSPNSAWKPSVAGPVEGPDANGQYTLTGTQLAGLTTGGVFGDDAQMDSNYPILRLTPQGATRPVYYLRETSLGDRTPAPGKTTSVKFVVPGNVPSGDYALQIVTNGIPSAPLGQGVPFRCTAAGCSAIAE